jgi:hypothetical protein
VPQTAAEIALKMMFLLALIGFTTAARSFISSSAALLLTGEVGTIVRSLPIGEQLLLLLLLLRPPTGVISGATVRKQAGRIPSDTSMTYLPGGVSRGRRMFSTSPYPPCKVTTTSLTAMQSKGTGQLPESTLPAVQLALLSLSLRPSV